jgi:hypothetical protein
MLASDEHHESPPSLSDQNKAVTISDVYNLIFGI